MSWKRLEDVLKTFSKHLEDVLKMSWKRLEDILKTSWRRLEDVLKMSWRRLEDVWPRRICWSWWRRRQGVFIKTNVCWERAGLRLSMTKKVNDKVGASKSVDAAALRCDLRYLNSEADIANARWHPRFPVHPI